MFTVAHQSQMSPPGLNHEASQAALKVVKAKKCNFALAEVRFLGHVVTQKGVKPDPEKVAIIEDIIKQPKNVTEVRAFLGRDDRIPQEIHKIKAMKQ